jgi:hypothetical protein
MCRSTCWRRSGGNVGGAAGRGLVENPSRNGETKKMMMMMMKKGDDEDRK